MQKIKLNNGERFSSPSEFLDYVCRSMANIGAERLYELYGKATKKGKLDADDLMFITDKNNSREVVELLYNGVYISILTPNFDKEDFSKEAPSDAIILKFHYIEFDYNDEAYEKIQDIVVDNLNYIQDYSEKIGLRVAVIRYNESLLNRRVKL